LFPLCLISVFYNVSDFGLSTRLAECELTRTQCGSPAFAAPEIFNHELYNKLVDVWSL